VFNHSSGRRINGRNESLARPSTREPLTFDGRDDLLIAAGPPVAGTTVAACCLGGIVELALFLQEHDDVRM
jgi:hypothetical protein